MFREGGYPEENSTELERAAAQAAVSAGEAKSWGLSGSAHKHLYPDIGIKVREAESRDEAKGQVVQAFPSRASSMRLVGAVLLDADESWLEWRWFEELSAMQAYGALPKSADETDDVDRDALGREAADVIRLAIGDTMVSRRRRAA